MINELLNNPAYLRLLKNATSLQANDIAKVPVEVIPNVPATLPMIITAPKSISETPITTSEVIKADASKSIGFGKILLYVGGFILLGIVVYNINDYLNPNDKTKKQ